MTETALAALGKHVLRAGAHEVSKDIAIHGLDHGSAGYTEDRVLTGLANPEVAFARLAGGGCLVWGTVIAK